MRPYEVMIILDPGLDDDVIRAEVDRVVETITSGGGTPGPVDRWGRRRLAYEIDHHREGYYVVVEASAEPEVMANLDRALNLADRVLRHKVVRLPEERAGRSARPHSSASPEAPSLAAETAAASSTDANGE